MCFLVSLPGHLIGKINNPPLFYQDRLLPFDNLEPTREKDRRGCEREHERHKGQLYIFYVLNFEV